MSNGIRIKKLLEQTDFSDAASIERYALNLEGMTFRDILDLDIHPDGEVEKDFSNVDFKGGMGNLIEERFFGYKSNSDAQADFPEAGVELKATCFDIRKRDHKPSAGERLVLTMIPYDRDIPSDFYSSHLWEKCKQILLVFYHRDRSINKYDQIIERAVLFTPPENDLRIIRDDYMKIASYIQAGRADELSEGMTVYLGASTKGSTAAKSLVNQHYPHIDPITGNAVWRKAKKRAFSLKRQYMDFVLNTYVLGKPSKAETLALDYSEHMNFEEAIELKLQPYFGKTDKDIAAEFGEVYNGRKSQWTTLVYRILGIKNNQAEEFLKANINVRVSRIMKNGHLKEHMSLSPFEFDEILSETWENSALRNELEGLKFFFVSFKETDRGYILDRCTFWNMPEADIDGPARQCWEDTRKTIREGVVLTPKLRSNGKIIYHNNLPGESDNPVAHVRPHAQLSAYRFEDGSERGNVQRDGSALPDGRYMTRQSFWLNKSYIEHAIGIEDAS